ncbi:carbohydrate-binding domain-containing protein [Rhodopirellula halodulae]|uniref:carbohydrate-binding domain-containing protein n=1 Tax=Rhodopirellula halodulae TaxID=2894198 RepID=UPI001E40E42C|nr:carbohydrate-binding domain-containing protein [Rhodopirellula sp. JC737]MCC9658879.1 LEPR-XLL domain-containing protein [Rhodopirellula sp. JC737]
MNFRNLLKPLKRRVLQRSQTASRRGSDVEWSAETLEPRLLLAGDAGQEISFAANASGIQIQAIGETGEEYLEVRYDNRDIGYMLLTTEWATYQFDVDYTSIDPSKLQIHFLNDLYDPDQGIDRNAQIGSVTIGDQVLSSDAADVFSTGTWLAEDGIVAGSGRGSVLNANGYLQYGTPTGSELVVYARGAEGAELMSVQAGEYHANRINVGTELQAYRFYVNEVIDPNSVRIEFLNDLYRPDLGIDQNLIIDRIELDGVTYQSEDASTYVTGVFRDGQIRSGYYQTEQIDARGYMQFDATTFESERYRLDQSIVGDGLTELTTTFPFDDHHAINSNNQSVLAWTETDWGQGSTFVRTINVQVVNADGTVDENFNGGEPVDLIAATMAHLNDTSGETYRYSLREVATDSQDRILAQVQKYDTNGFFNNYTTFLIRLQADGQFDAGFASNGFLQINEGSITTASAMALDGQDRILVSNATTIARYNSDGSADNSFGDSGSTGIPAPDVANYTPGSTKLAIRDDNSIVVLTGLQYNANPSANYLVQLNEDGSTGTWFGDNGIVSIPYQQFSLYSNFSERFEQMIVDDQGRITLLGDVAVLRYTINGQLDATFGDGGRTLLPEYTVSDGQVFFGSYNNFFIQDGEGRFLIPYVGGLARLTADGQLDATFGGGDGLAAFQPIENGNLQTYSVREGLIDNDGELRTLARANTGFGVAYWELV